MEQIEKVEINEKTTVPLFQAIAVIAGIAGIVIWISSGFAAGYASEKRLDKVESIIMQIKDDISYLRAREEYREKLNK